MAEGKSGGMPVVMPWILSVLGLAGFLLVAYLLITYGLPLVGPFVVALLIAELVEPVVTFLNRRLRMPRSLAVLVVLVAFIALLSVALIAGISKLVQEIQAFIYNLPFMYDSALDLVAQLSAQFGAFSDSLPESVQEMINANLANLQNTLNRMLPSLTGTLGVVSSLPSLLTSLLVAFLATYFMSRDRSMIGQFLLSLFPSAWRSKLREVRLDVWNSTIGWAKAEILLITLTMVQSIIGFSLIGSKYAVLAGVAVGIADVLPILGPATIYVPWIIYTFFFGDRVFSLKLLILYLIVAGVRQVLEPKMVGDRVGLHPLATLFALYLGIKVFGAWGVLFGPLLAILLKAMINSGLLPIFQEEKPKA